MSNYECIIAKVDSVFPINGADKIQGAKVLGETVVVSKDIEVGHVGAFFCAGTQLSEQYAHENNLYRDKEKNKDIEKAGFFENSRRVRAQPFLKLKSEAYFSNLESLNFAGDISTLKVGDKFEDFNGVNICKKYISERALRAIGNKTTKAIKKDSVPHFQQHVETGQFKYNTHLLEVGDLVSIQSKRHGSSFRVGYLKKITPLTGWKALVQKVLPIFKTESYELVVGSRRVILDKPEREGFHGSEGYRFEVAEQLKPYLTKGMTVYGEIVGWVNGKPIMSPHSTSGLKDKAFTKKYGETIIYKYGAQENTYKFHIYRITLSTEDGTSIDFTQQQLVQWCKDRGLEPSYDIVKPFIYDGDIEKLTTLVEELTERPDVLTEDYHDSSMISEGIILRLDRGTTTPLFLKNKSYAFKVLEGLVKEDEVDTEEVS